MAQEKHKHMSGSSSAGGAVYGLGMIGAAIYFLQNSQTFVEVLLGIAKAVVWPAILIYRVFQNLGF